MYGEIAAAIQSAKALRELVKSATSLSNYNELLNAVSDVNSKLMEATAVALKSQEAESRHLARIRDLEDELQKIAGWEAQAARYLLRELSPGKFVYALRPESANGEPAHMLCANCFVKQQKALLQLRVENDHGHWYICHNCKTEIVAPGAARPGTTFFAFS